MLKRFFSSFLVIIVLCFSWIHNSFMAFAEESEHTSCEHCACHESKQKQVTECCFLSGDISPQNNCIQDNIWKKFSKKILSWDIDIIKQNFQIIKTNESLSFQTRYKRIFDPPPNFYTTLIGIIKQSK